MNGDADGGGRQRGCVVHAIAHHEDRSIALRALDENHLVFGAKSAVAKFSRNTQRVAHGQDRAGLVAGKNLHA